MLDIFGDGRKRPKLSINVKVKIDTDNKSEASNWNAVFGYFMKKQRTKLEYLNINAIRNLNISSIKLFDIQNYISKDDFEQLQKVENIFNNDLTSDVKAFLLSILKIKYSILSDIISLKNK